MSAHTATDSEPLGEERAFPTDRLLASRRQELSQEGTGAVVAGPESHRTSNWFSFRCNVYPPWQILAVETVGNARMGSTAYRRCRLRRTGALCALAHSVVDQAARSGS